MTPTVVRPLHADDIPWDGPADPVSRQIPPTSDPDGVCPVCRVLTCEDPTHLAPASSSDNDAPPDASRIDPDEPRPTGAAFRPAADVIADPSRDDIVEGIAKAGDTNVLVSESGAGKTFVLLSLAAAVSDDAAWHGRQVQHGTVAYVSFEGDALGLRLGALRDVQGHRLHHLHVLRASAPLSPVVDRDHVERPSAGERLVADALADLRDRLAQRGDPPIVLIVIDTVRASLAGSEDSSENVSAYLRAVRRLVAHVPGAAALLAHHAGWQDGESRRQRERGSSAWRGNCDGTLYLEAGEFDPTTGEAELTVRALKLRDSELPPPLHLIRRRVELADAAGDDVRRGPKTSCIIERDRRSHADREAERERDVAAADHDTDVAVLRVLRDHPDATSLRTIRAYVGIMDVRVRASMTRLLHAGWIVPPTKQRQPYTLTESGLEALR